MSHPILTFVITLAMLCSTAILPQRVYADDTAVASEQISRQMRQYQVVKGRFEQWRNLTGIPRPIRSSGRFIYWRKHGLYWETQKPISQASTFTSDAIIHWQSDTATRQADRSSSPVQKHISRILLAVFGGDLQALEKLFDSRWSSAAEHWIVDLTPTATTVKQVIQKITLSGGDYINSLSLDASNGDTTQIHFTHISAFAHPATDDCRFFDLDFSSCPSNETGTPPSSQMEP